MSIRRAIAAAMLAAGVLAAGCGPLAILPGFSGPRAQGGPSVGLELVAEGLSSPVAAVAPADGSGRLFVVDQIGLIRIVEAGGELVEEPFLDVRDRMIGLNPAYDERGLLGLAFHPDYAENGRFFVHYTAPLREGAPQGWDNTVRISEFAVSDAPNVADPGSERILLEVDEPQANHQGGTVAFGADACLYISLGDGGGANDTSTGHNPQIGNGQDTSTLLGKILRIDVDGEEPYTIPEDNPFASGGGRPEIYAWGLRNPYRFSFDRQTGELFAADAGQNLFEEASIIEGGGNYGWNIREGFHCFSPRSPGDSPDACPEVGAGGEPLLSPILEYTHDVGLTIVGGYPCRGEALPSEWKGAYVFADWSASFVRGDGTLLRATRPQAEGEPWPFEEVRIATDPEGDVGLFILGLGQDAEGELYLLCQQFPGPVGESGKVFKVAPAQD